MKTIITKGKEAINLRAGGRAWEESWGKEIRRAGGRRKTERMM